MDIAARNALVIQWMPLARKLVQQMWNELYERRIGSIEDGFQLAYSALLRAAELYKPDHSSKATFSTYVCHAVRNRIRMSVSQGLIRVPVACACDYNRASNGKPLFYKTGKDRLDAAEHAFYGGRALIDHPLAKREPSFSGEFERLLNFLPKSQAKVIRLRFVEDWTLKEIGELIGRSRQRVKQIEAAALEKLRRLVKPTHCGEPAPA
jgi:RNA polymerase sigma factor (sigma-70 family)